MTLRDRSPNMVLLTRDGFVALLLLLICQPQETEQQRGFPKLKLVQIAYRHGARSPLYTYPNDPNRGYPWPQGLEQLLPTKMHETMELGEFIKDRYRGYLSEEYVIDEIYVRSSDSDRTIMSAELVLTGMYPTIPQQTWSPDYTWQPTSFHTVPEEDDHAIGKFKADWGPICPRYKLLMAQTEADPDFQKLNNSYAYLYSYLNAHGGTHETNPYMLTGYLDATECARLLNLPTPDWITDEVYYLLANDIHKVRWVWMLGGNNGVMKKTLFSGVFIDELLTYMEQSIKGKTKEKMIQYCTHDDQIASMLMMTMQNNDAVPHFLFDSAVFYELHEVSRNQYAVRVLFKNGTDTELYPVPVVGCSNVMWCPLVEFEELMGVYRLRDEDWDEACGKVSFEKKVEYGLIGMAIAVLILIIFMIVLVVYARSLFNQLETLRRQNELDYQARLRAHPPPPGPRRRSETIPLLGDRRKFDIRA